MRINETKPNKNIQIDVVQGAKRLEFASKSVAADGNSLLIECISYKGTTINLSTSSAQINTTIYMEPSPVMFTNVKIDLVKKDGMQYHRISAPFQGRKINRRNSYRVFIGEQGTVQVGNSKKNQNVLVKDISETGFAVVSEDDLQADNAKIKLSYEDKNTTVILQGQVVRKDKTPKNSYLYGCKLDKNPKGLGKYLAKKQQIRRR